MSIQLEIVTPEKLAYSETVDAVVLPGVEGEMGALTGHEPLMTMIQPGDLQVQQSGETHHLAVGEGFVEVTGSKVTVLTDMALEEKEIDVDHVEKALESARKALEGKDEHSEEAAMLRATIQKQLAQLNVKRRRR
ncbi:MAG: ATP synthase F1 subunit epsilon [Verrucomicrobiota bacterium]